MPEAAARSRMASRGKASDSSKRGTYLSSIAAVRTDRSPCKLARTSCAGGNAAACPNLCTYLRATQCSPARTIILSTSPGPASPSTERHRAPHALRAPSYLQERERERRRRPGPETAAAHPPPPPARRFCASIACSSVVVGNSLRSWNSRANRSAAANCLPSTRRRTRAHVSNAGLASSELLRRPRESHEHSRHHCDAAACGRVQQTTPDHASPPRLARPPPWRGLPGGQGASLPASRSAGSRDQRRTCSHARRRPGPASAPPRPRSSLTRDCPRLAELSRD
mmetsp:Transcript_3295/g.10924  ORF Transcript_3295/g.10924 Transcript_3295/m.10924 type:complete len:282 (-) Transcript_3295:279-1124(-)